MPNHWPTSSLLHPLYGSAARDIRGAVGASHGEQLDRLARQLDGVRRAIVLRDRDYRGLVISQAGTYLGARVTPDHKRYVSIYSPDDTIRVEAGRHPHELALRVDTDVVCVECDCECPDPDIEAIKGRLLADTTFLGEICTYCDTGTPPSPWPGGH